MSCSDDTFWFQRQTVYLDQNAFFGYLKQSRFSFLPQVHDASPRVSTQALSHDVPVLMNKNIKGGWKYVIKLNPLPAGI